MQREKKGDLRRAYSQTSDSSTSAHAPAPANMNALKHGLRSSAILLPDDDAAEFEGLRHDLFHTYQPRTRDEAACVDAMAGHQWRMARCQRWQAVYDTMLDAMLRGDPDATAGQHCEADPHRWMHRSMDCVLQETRLERLLTRARDKLMQLQWQRRNHLIPGAVETVVDYRELELKGEIPAGSGEAEATGESAAQARPAPGARTRVNGTGAARPVTDSRANGNGKINKRAEQDRLNGLLQRLRPTVGHG